MARKALRLRGLSPGPLVRKTKGEGHKPSPTASLPPTTKLRLFVYPGKDVPDTYCVGFEMSRFVTKGEYKGRTFKKRMFLTPWTLKHEEVKQLFDFYVSLFNATVDGTAK